MNNPIRLTDFNRPVFIKGAWSSLLLVLILISGTVSAEIPSAPLPFTLHTVTEGPITVRLNPIDVVSEYNRPYWLDYEIENSGDTPVSCQLRFHSADRVCPVELYKDSQGREQFACQTDLFSSVTIPTGGKNKGRFPFVAQTGTYNAHYPLHLHADFNYDGQARQAHSIRVIQTNLPSLPKPDSVTEIKIGGVSLLNKMYTAYRDYPNESKIELGTCWHGTDAVSRTYLETGSADRGDNRPCFIAHPPYRPCGGSLYLQFPVKLPSAKKVSLNFATAMRTVLPPEPPSDGVTFRVLVDNTMVDQTHTSSTSWVERIVDLSAYAGRQVNLTIQINPGPKNDTTCDGCFISGVTIDSSNSDAAIPFAPVDLTPVRFDLTKYRWATITPGDRGLINAKIVLSDNNKSIEFNGIRFNVGGVNLSSPSTRFLKAPSLKMEGEKLVFRCSVLINDKEYPVELIVRSEKGLLLIDNPNQYAEFSSQIQLGQANQTANRVYFGHGYVLEQPKAFRIYGGGHNLSTSHVGFDFADGLSVLLASSAPPTALEVNPDNHLYTLNVSGATTLAILPCGSGNAISAAIEFRDSSPWKSAPSKAVIRKRGRLVFDVWGGSFSENQKNLEKAFQYGVTDAMFIKHVWQRWGYDIKLPDIWPPNPKMGTLSDLQRLCHACVSRNVPFGLHDNYIDFYPDADDFSYRYITFNDNGQPRKAWINYGAGVQSYQWRPDLFKPFLERNLKHGLEFLPEQDAYFIDVFLSTGIFDYHDQKGNYYPRSLTRDCWKDCFETISRYLSHTDSAGQTQFGITCSEAADDFLIGSIDGGDAQWIEISPQGNYPYMMTIPCKNWARTPWFAAVNHTNFSRHGAGYANRFCSVRNSALHSITSDDYLSAELLGGLDLMVDVNSVFPGSIRKYYLLQNIVRNLADKEIKSVQYEPDNLLKQTVEWSDGTRVIVNRDTEDWTIHNYTLPQYGFVVVDKSQQFLAGLIRENGQIIERSVTPDGIYLNGHGYPQSDLELISPSMAKAEIIDECSFKIIVNWNADRPTDKDLSTFVHIFEPYRGYGHTPKGWYAGGEPVKSSQWKSGEIIQTGTMQILTVPNDATQVPTGKYAILVGLYDSQGNGSRRNLIGIDAQAQRYQIGILNVQRNGDSMKISIEPTPFQGATELYKRLLPNQHPAQFAGITTSGAVFVKGVFPPNDSINSTAVKNTSTAESVEKSAKMTLIPLPFMPSFDVSLDENQLGIIHRITADGQEIPLKRNGKNITFSVTTDTYRQYEVE